jgi:hypothetical protein
MACVLCSTWQTRCKDCEIKKLEELIHSLTLDLNKVKALWGPIAVRQFKHGNQGYSEVRARIRRTLHESETLAPVWSGVCVEPLKMRRFHWVTIGGDRWPVHFDKRHSTWTFAVREGTFSTEQFKAMENS